MTFPDPILDELKELGWTIYRNEDPDVDWTPERGYILERKTSNGTPTYLVVSEDRLLEDVWDAWTGFDKERYVSDLIGIKPVSADTIEGYRKDAFEIKEVYARLYMNIRETLHIPCDLTIWVDQYMIPMEIIRLVEILRSKLSWWFPIFDGVNGTIVYKDISLSGATILAHALKEEVTLCPIEYEIKILKD